MISLCNEMTPLLSPANPSNRITSPLSASLHRWRGLLESATNMKPRNAIKGKKHFQKIPAEKRFWEKVNKNGRQMPHVPELGNCWEWIGCRTGNKKYGQFYGDDGNVPAHRFSYELHNGKVPNGKIVMHRCDNPPCIRPTHLQAGTSKENSLDMIKKFRHWAHNYPEKLARGNRNGAHTHPECVKRGSCHSNAKLTEQQIIAIREMDAAGMLFGQIARLFRVNGETISRIVKHKTWKHV